MLGRSAVSYIRTFTYAWPIQLTGHGIRVPEALGAVRSARERQSSSSRLVDVARRLRNLLAMYVCPLLPLQRTVGTVGQSRGDFVSARCMGRGRLVAAAPIAIMFALLVTMRTAAAATPGCEAHAVRAHQALLADRLDNWEPLDDRTVLIWTRRSDRAHLLRLEAPLAGLEEADIIHLVDGDRDALISPCGRDGIAIGDDAAGWQIARIVAVELLSRKRTAELDFGTRAKIAAAGSLRI